jgi:hypothetical protein
VQVVWRDPKLEIDPSFARRIVGFDLELTPERVDVFLAVVHPCKLHEVISHGGMCTVSANHEVKIDLYLSWAT